MRDGIRDAGGIPIEFPVHPIQETGKRPTAALDRNLAYLSLVESLYGYFFDGVVLTTGCDKTTPAMIMGACTVNIPSIVLSGGPMLDGHYAGGLAGSGTIVWYARQELAAGRIDMPTFMKWVADSAPSVGHCNTMGTALSMNSMAEALGLSLPGCAAIPGPYRERGQMAYETGKRIVDMVWEDLKPSDILTREAFENAIVAASALGASTNCPPHVNAIARHIGVELDNADWDKIGYDIPLLVNCMPAGKYLGEAFHRAGGVPTVMRELLAKNKIHGDAMTVTGKTYAENLKTAKPADGEVIKTYDKPMLGQAGFAVLSGNLFDSRDHEDLGDLARVPQEVPREARRQGRLRGHRDRVRGAGGLSPPHQRSVAADRREQHPVHPQHRPGRLSRRGRGGEHAAAGPAGEGRGAAAAVRRRRPAERHVGQPVDPQCLARGGGRRRPGAAQDRRQGAGSISASAPPTS